MPLNYDSEKVRKIIQSRHIADAVYFKMNGNFYEVKIDKKCTKNQQKKN